MEQCAHFGTQFNMVCLAPDSIRCFIGADLAGLLNKETFNLYTSLRRRGIETHKISHAALNDLIARAIVPRGTTSVTLVPATPETMQFVQECLDLLPRKRGKRPLETKNTHEEMEATATLANLASNQ